MARPTREEVFERIAGLTAVELREPAAALYPAEAQESEALTMRVVVDASALLEYLLRKIPRRQTKVSPFRSSRPIAMRPIP